MAKLNFSINVILILGKFFIHKCKCMKTKPYYSVFKSDFSLYFLLYFASLNYMESKQACKFVGMIKVGFLEDGWKEPSALTVKEYEERCKSSLFYDRNVNRLIISTNSTFVNVYGHYEQVFGS